MHVVDGVAVREVEVWLEGARGGFGEGAGPGGPERAAVDESVFGALWNGLVLMRWSKGRLTLVSSDRGQAVLGLGQWLDRRHRGCRSVL